jgi:RNA polymerase sigma factor (sigma-70 family)
MAEFEEQNLADLVGENGAAMVRTARSLLHSEADAEDVVQDALLTVLSAPNVLAVVENVGGWLYTVVRRRCVDLLRRESTRRSAERENALRELLDDASEVGTDLEQEELVAGLADALRRLDEPLRFAFVENALEGRTFREISAASGIPMGTLMARKQRAVEAIRDELRHRGLISADAAGEKESEP